MLIRDLQLIANDLRLDVLSMAKGEVGVHLAGPLSSAELFATLYFGGVLRLSAKEPWYDERDRVVLSCGHYAPILYAALARANYFEKERLLSFGKAQGLPVHPERIEGENNLAGVEASTGPLAQGMSVAVGMAKALKLKRKQARVYCVVSDGELQEGQAWEAIGLAVREKLDNLVFLIDNNNVQIEHYVSELAGDVPLSAKLEAWGVNVLEIDGHNVEKILVALEKVRQERSLTSAIVLRTIGGKGVSFMENNPKWHDGVLSEEQFEQAKREILSLNQTSNRGQIDV